MPKPRVPQDEQAARRKQWRDDNAEARRQYIKEWRARNKEHVTEYAKAYVSTDKGQAVKKTAAKKYYAETIKSDPAKLLRRSEYSKKRDATNPDKLKARTKKYRATHREILNAKNHAAYYSKSPEERKALRAALKEYAKQWREANKDKIILDAQKRYAENKEQYAERYKASYEKNRVEFINRARARQRNLQGRGTFTQADVDRMYEQQKGRCMNCSVSIADKFDIDHVMPISLGGSNTADNLQLLCVLCNRRKHALHPDEWARRNGKLFA